MCTRLQKSHWELSRVLFCCVVLVGQRLTSAQSVSPPRLRAEVAGTKNCEGHDGEIYVSQRTLRVHFTNNDGKPIILYRRVYLSDIVLGKRVINGEIGDLESPMSFTVATASGAAEALKDIWPNNQFVLLKPGQTYSTTLVVPIFVKQRPDSPAGLAEGLH